MSIRHKRPNLRKGNGRGKSKTKATAPTRNGQTAAESASVEYGRERILLELKVAAIESYLAAKAARDAAKADSDDPEWGETAGVGLADYLVSQAEETLTNALLVTNATHEMDVDKQMRIHQAGRAVAYRDRMYLVLPDPDCGSAYGKESEDCWMMRLHIVPMQHYDDLDCQL